MKKPTKPSERAGWDRERYMAEIKEFRDEVRRMESCAGLLSRHADELCSETVKFTVKDLPLLKDT